MKPEILGGQPNFSPRNGESGHRLEREQPQYPTFDELFNKYQRKKESGTGCFTVKTKLATINGLQNGSQPYNASICFQDGNLRMYGRVDVPNSEIGTSLAFDPDRHNPGEWSVNGFKTPMEDPRPTIIGGKVAIFGTGTKPQEKDPTRVETFWPVLVLQAPDGSIEKYEFTRLRDTKDLTVISRKTNANGKTLVDFITRDRKEDPKTKKITCTVHKGSAFINNPDDLHNALAEAHGGPETMLNAGLPKGEDDRWFGFMQLIPLVNGNTGVLSHDAVVRYIADPDPKKPIQKERIYVTTTREYDKNWKLVGNPEIISIAEDYEDTEAKWPDLQKVLVGMNLIYGRDNKGNIVSCTLVGGLRDTRVALGTLSQLPFSAEPDQKLNELYIADIRTLQEQGIPVRHASLALAA